MRWRSIAPFCRDDGPQTDPMIRFPATSRHSGLTKVSTTESHGKARKESLKFILRHSAAQRCVHALALSRGRTAERLQQIGGLIRLVARRLDQAGPALPLLAD